MSQDRFYIAVLRTFEPRVLQSMWPFKSFVDLVRFVHEPERSNAYKCAKKEDEVKPFMIKLEL